MANQVLATVDTKRKCFIASPVRVDSIRLVKRKRVLHRTSFIYKSILLCKPSVLRNSCFNAYSTFNQMRATVTGFTFPSIEMKRVSLVVVTIKAVMKNVAGDDCGSDLNSGTKVTTGDTHPDLAIFDDGIFSRIVAYVPSPGVDSGRWSIVVERGIQKAGRSTGTVDVGITAACRFGNAVTVGRQRHWHHSRHWHHIRLWDRSKHWYRSRYWDHSRYWDRDNSRHWDRDHNRHVDRHNWLL